MKSNLTINKDTQKAILQAMLQTLRGLEDCLVQDSALPKYIGLPTRS